MLSQRELEVFSGIRVAWCDLGHLVEEYSAMLAQRVAREPVELGAHRVWLNTRGELLLNGRLAKECDP